MQITINGTSAKSLQLAAKKVRAYKNRVIENNGEFLKHLADVGIYSAEGHVYNIADDYDPPSFSTENPHVMNGESSAHKSITLRLQGEQVVFVEFGAGVHYNGSAGSSPHPLGVKLGYTIGSYGYGHGRHDYWDYVKDGEYHVTQGTPAAMPLYHASVEMKQSARVLALAHFRS